MAEKPYEVEAADKLLSSGLWVSGASLLRAMGEVIPPGKAERFIESKLDSPELYSRDRKIEMGRRRLIQERVAYRLRARLWVTEPEQLTKAHWLGLEPWKVRDKYPNSLGLQEMTDRINEIRPDLKLNRHKLNKWIGAGVVPRPIKPNLGPWLVTQELQEVYLRVARAAPARAGRWEVEPSSLWRTPSPAVSCPHCGHELDLVVSVRKSLVFDRENSRDQSSEQPDDQEDDPEDLSDDEFGQMMGPPDELDEPDLRGANHPEVDHPEADHPEADHPDPSPTDAIPSR